MAFTFLCLFSTDAPPKFNSSHLKSYNLKKKTIVFQSPVLEVMLYHLKSRWRNSHILVYHGPFGSCAIYFHYGVNFRGVIFSLLSTSTLDLYGLTQDAR